MKYFSSKPPDKYTAQWFHQALIDIETVMNANEDAVLGAGVAGIHATGNSDLTGSVEIVSGTNMTVTHSAGKLVLTSAGEAGPKGDTGADGPRGPSGPRGVQGPAGALSLVAELEGGTPIDTYQLNVDGGWPWTVYGGNVTLSGGDVNGS